MRRIAHPRLIDQTPGRFFFAMLGGEPRHHVMQLLMPEWEHRRIATALALVASFRGGETLRCDYDSGLSTVASYFAPALEVSDQVAEDVPCV